MIRRGLVICVAGVMAWSACAQEEVPRGFAITTVATGVEEPIALAVAPDGRLFVASRQGKVHVFSEGVGAQAPFAEIDAYTFGEAGLLGMALDPDFSRNGYVYLFATVSSDEQQILRFTDDAGMGRDRTVIRANLPSSGDFHNGGGLRFGADGKLYFSIGDTGRSELSQQINTFAGKVCRIAADGVTPEDNPFVTPTGTPRAVFALGFRNPFRFCFAPDGRLFVMDVGSNGDGRREEINIVKAGANHGWPIVEGVSGAGDLAEYVDPILQYDEKGSAIAGCVYYDGGSALSGGSRFPQANVGDLFHLDFTTQRLFRVVLDGDRAVTHEQFAQLEGGPVDLAMALDGSLLYTEFFTGRVKRLAYLRDTTGPLDDSPADGGVLPDPPRTPRACGAGLLTVLALASACLFRIHPHRR